MMIVDLVFGFLGSGKTTFIKQILNDWGREEKTVVLVNEFGDVGIDGELLASQGATVVEMPSGCICCTLTADFRNQIREIRSVINPDRIIIEPTGVATIAQIQGILASQVADGGISALHKILIADAKGFMKLYKANRYFVESQVEHAHIAVLNKCDLVDKQKALLISSAISAINPEISVFMTQFGILDWQEYRLALSSAQTKPTAFNQMLGLPRRQDQHDHSTDSLSKVNQVLGQDQTQEDYSPDIDFDAEAPNLGYESFGAVFENQSFDSQRLEALFQDLNTRESSLGKIVRAKGIFLTADHWRVIELASNEISSQPIRASVQSKICIIGNALKRQQIHEALERCLTG